MKCWICGNEANSGEHITKASDIRSVFGHVSQNKPLFFHELHKLNQRVNGVNADKLKFKALICDYCNSTRTQPHDRAWESLSKYLRCRTPELRPGSIINLSRVFPGKVHRSMLAIHLYFVKLFGCLIAENGICIDLKEFSDSILKNCPHSSIYLAFEVITDRRFHKHIGRSPLQAVLLNKSVQYGLWLYDVGCISVHVVYAKPNQHRLGLINSWHPASVTKIVKFLK